MEVYETACRQETADLGQAFAKRVRGGQVIAFTGGLGAGKTAFCAGLAKGLGCVDEASSPTFSIVNLYRGPVPLAHFDMYRLSTEEDLWVCGFYDYIDQGAVVAVEWSENVSAFMDPPDYLIDIQVTGEDRRKITITEMIH